MEVTLQRLRENGAYAYEAIFLTQLKSYSFGQMASNDFILYAPTVEYNHCIFHNQMNGLFVEVLKNSSAVLIINGRECLSNSVVRLNNNDIINIGLFLKYKVKMETAISLADNSDNNYVKDENDSKDGFPCHNVNDSNVENLGNKEADLDYFFEHKRISDSLLTKEHLPDYLSEKQPPYDPCDKSYMSEKDNRFHFGHSTRKFKCSFCEKCFVTKHRLKQHMQVHSTEKSIKCSICEKNFGTKYRLKQHMQVHSTEKSFKCSLCEKCFGTKYRLQQHMLVHSTEKTFKCFLCEKNFRRKGSLQQHTLTHFTEKKLK